MVFATTRQIAALYFSDTRTASRRLGKLLAIGHVNVFVPRLDGPNVYALSERGLDFLVRMGADAGELHVGRSARRLDLPHLLAIGDLRIALAVACRAHASVALDLVLADQDLRRAAGRNVPTYLPDALVRLQTPVGPVGLTAVPSDPIDVQGCLRMSCMSGSEWWKNTVGTLPFSSMSTSNSVSTGSVPRAAMSSLMRLPWKGLFFA